MDETTPDPIETVLAKWRTASRGKKLLLGLAGVLGVLFILFIIGTLQSLQNNSTGLSVESYPDYSDGGMPVPSGAYERLPPLPSFPPLPPPIPGHDYVTGNTAEAYETTDYTAMIESTNGSETCTALRMLKGTAGTVFLSASEQKTGCTFTFKVTTSETARVLALVESLDPKELRESTYTLKEQRENTLNERDILTENLRATEQTLTDALAAYDSLLATAISEQNSTALTTAVRDKIEIIDMLKNRREQTRQQIDFMNRQLAEQEDKLLYTYFTVTVFENRFFNLEYLKDSWRDEVRSMITTVNTIFQNLTLGLLTFAMHALLYAIYFLVVLVVVKFLWRIVKTVWRS